MKRLLLIPTLALVLGLGITACKGSAQSQFDPCTVNPTYQAIDGNWYEADGERLDDDPCDSDDFETDTFGHLVNRKKPKVVTPTTKPAPRVVTPAKTPAKVTTKSTRR